MSFKKVDEYTRLKRALDAHRDDCSRFGVTVEDVFFEVGGSTIWVNGIAIGGADLTASLERAKRLAAKLRKRLDDAENHADKQVPENDYDRWVATTEKYIEDHRIEVKSAVLGAGGKIKGAGPSYISI